MAVIHGKNARIQWDAPAGQSDINLTLGQSWTLDIVGDAPEITSMQDTWATFLPGFRDWTATVECLLPAAGTDVPIGGDDGFGDDECRLELYAVYAAGDYDGFYGTAICNGVSMGMNKDELATVTYTFQGVDHLKWFSGAARPA
jgi:hypothetical protein